MKINNKRLTFLRNYICIIKEFSRRKPEIHLTYFALLTLVIPMLFLSCAGMQRQKFLLNNEMDLSLLLVDKLDKFEASGDVSILFERERHQAEIYAAIKEEGNFICEIYGPFAQVIASFISDQDSARITLGDHEYRIGINDNLSFIPFLKKYPFIFTDFIRILSGRVYKSNCFSDNADTLWREGRRHVYQWISDSVRVSAAVSRKGKKIKNVTFSTLGVPYWKLEYSSFNKGISRKINFLSGEKNYFSIVFESIWLWR